MHEETTDDNWSVESENLRSEVCGDTEWVTEYSDRFAIKERRGDDEIKLRRPTTHRSHYEVVARIGDECYHTIHDDEDEAMEQLATFELLADYTIEFETGDDVYAIDAAFEPIVQRGRVVRNVDRYETVSVRFESDPYTKDATRRRRVDVKPESLIHADADDAEVLLYLGYVDMLRPEDLR